MRALAALESYEIITRTHDELDLSDRIATREFFMSQRPDYVIMCAAKVGGILANASFPVDFLHNNLAIQVSVFDAAHASGVERMSFLAARVSTHGIARNRYERTTFYPAPLKRQIVPTLWRR
ncbi:hypothetical protein AJ88_43390 [Mesorhizobium amorphae CCBAU 01583]|nr:hypothetical protein AJ88_43390 [Mesorhizobium amorphae CCBAU 01583]